MKSIFFRRSIMTAALGSLLLSPGLLSFYQSAAAQAAATDSTSTDSDVRDFSWIKAHAKKQVWNHPDVGTVNVWAAVVSKDSLSKASTVLIYGELHFPYTMQELDYEDGSTQLKNESNYVFYNGGIKTWLKSSDEDPKGKWDRTIFTVDSISPDGIIVRGGSVELTLKGETTTITIDSQPAVVNTSELEEAIGEHWNEYQAAKSRGMLFDSTSEDAYKQANEKAHSLVEKAKATGSKVTNEEVDQMRQELNRVYDALAPLPFDRTKLNAAATRADKVFSSNGTNGKRIILADYERLRDAYTQAKQLIETPDLRTIKVAHEAPPVVTHKDFTDAATNLENVLSSLGYEDYPGTKTDENNKARDAAIVKVPALGKKFSDETRAALIAAIDEIAQVDPVYATTDELKAAKSKLDQAVAALKEVDADNKQLVDVHIRYKHDLEDAPSNLIKEYYRNSAGDPLETVLTYPEGTDIVIPLSNSEIVKQFSGMRVIGLNYAGRVDANNDARIFVDSHGQRYLRLRVSGTEASTGAGRNASVSLDLLYGPGKANEATVPPTSTTEIPDLTGGSTTSTTETPETAEETASATSSATTPSKTSTTPPERNTLPESGSPNTTSPTTGSAYSNAGKTETGAKDAEGETSGNVSNTIGQSQRDVTTSEESKQQQEKASNPKGTTGKNNKVKKAVPIALTGSQSTTWAICAFGLVLAGSYLVRKRRFDK